MSSDPFRNAEDEYFRLKGQLATGRITRQQFDAALKKLMVQDAQGRWWMLGADSGKWNIYDGKSWVEGDSHAVSALPPAPPSGLPERGGLRLKPRLTTPEPVAPPAPAATKSGGGCGKPLACGCLAVILLCSVVGVGGFLAYQSGAITPTTLLNLVGLGPADIEVDNFRDDTVYVTITQLDAPPDSTPARAALQIKAFDIAAYRAQTSGRYRVNFGTTSGGANLGTCTLTIKSGDQYQFVTLPNNIAVNRANNPASVGTDFVVATSALCR